MDRVKIRYLLAILVIVALIACTPFENGGTTTSTDLVWEDIEWDENIWIERLGISVREDSSIHLIISVQESRHAIEQETAVGERSTLEITAEYWKEVCRYSHAVDQSIRDAYGFLATVVVREASEFPNVLNCVSPLSGHITLSSLQTRDMFFWTNYELHLWLDHAAIGYIRQVQVDLPGDERLLDTSLPESITFDREDRGIARWHISPLVPVTSLQAGGVSTDDTVELAVSSSSMNWERVLAFLGGGGFVAILVAILQVVGERRRESNEDREAIEQEGGKLTPMGEVEVDDLERIEGVGPKIARALCSADITTFAQIAEMEVDHLEKIVREAGIMLPSAQTWPEQAKLAAMGKWKELKDLKDRL